MKVDVSKLRDQLRDPGRLAALRTARTTALGRAEREIARAKRKDRIERIHVPDAMPAAIDEKLESRYHAGLETDGGR